MSKLWRRRLNQPQYSHDLIRGKVRHIWIDKENNRLEVQNYLRSRHCGQFKTGNPAA